MWCLFTQHSWTTVSCEVSSQRWWNVWGCKIHGCMKSMRYESPGEEWKVRYSTIGRRSIRFQKMRSSYDMASTSDSPMIRHDSLTYTNGMVASSLMNLSTGQAWPTLISWHIWSLSESIRMTTSLLTHRNRRASRRYTGDDSTSEVWRRVQTRWCSEYRSWSNSRSITQGGRETSGKRNRTMSGRRTRMGRYWMHQSTCGTTSSTEQGISSWTSMERSSRSLKHIFFNFHLYDFYGLSRD